MVFDTIILQRFSLLTKMLIPIIIHIDYKYIILILIDNIQKSIHNMMKNIIIFCFYNHLPSIFYLEMCFIFIYMRVQKDLLNYR